MLGEMRTAKEKVHIRIIGTEVWLWVTIISIASWYSGLRVKDQQGFIFWLYCSKLYKLGALKHQKMFSHCFGGQKSKVS